MVVPIIMLTELDIMFYGFDDIECILSGRSDLDISADYPQCLDDGYHGEVFAVSDDLVIDDLVIKVPKSLDNMFLRLKRKSVADVIKDLESEFEIQMQLYEGGVSVPKPKGMYVCKLPIVNGILSLFPLKRKYFGLVMERLSGINGATAYGEGTAEQEKLTDMTIAELEKAKSLGFEPWDTGLHNTIYNPEMDKLWLVDFVGWSTTTRDDNIISRRR